MVTEPRPVPGVGVAIVHDSRLLVVEKALGPFLGLWGIPGGKVEFGETRPEAAHREVAEETGLGIELGDVIWIGESIGPGDPPAWHFTLIDYLATWIDGVVTPGDDASDARWVTLDDLERLPLIPLMSEIIEPLRRRI